MASNFDFVAAEWPELAEPAVKAESYVRGDSRSVCFYARRALELAVDWLYAHDSAFRLPYEKNLPALIAEPTFRHNLPPGLHLKAKTIKDLGNLAVHSSKAILKKDAERAVVELFHFLYWLKGLSVPIKWTSQANGSLSVMGATVSAMSRAFMPSASSSLKPMILQFHKSAPGFYKKCFNARKRVGPATHSAEAAPAVAVPQGASSPNSFAPDGNPALSKAA